MGKFDILAQINKMTGPKAATTETKVEQTKPVEKVAPVKKTKAEPAPVEKKVEPETKALATADNTLPAIEVKPSGFLAFTKSMVTWLEENLGGTFARILRLKKEGSEIVVMADKDKVARKLDGEPLYYLGTANGAYSCSFDDQATLGATPAEWEATRQKGIEVPLQLHLTFYFADERGAIYNFTAYGRYDMNAMKSLLTSGPAWVHLATTQVEDKKFKGKKHDVMVVAPHGPMREWTDEQLVAMQQVVKDRIDYLYAEGWITGKPEVVAPDDDEELPA